MRKTVRISELANRCHFQYHGKDVEIDGLGLCNRETEGLSVLAYVTNDKYTELVRKNYAISGLVISQNLLNAYSKSTIGREITYIISEKPELCFYGIHEELCRMETFYEKYDFTPIIGKDCKIAESAIIEKGVKIGNHVTIGPNTVIRSGSIIDDNTIIGCNTTIGSEGFQVITDGDNPPLHITHVGRCHICANVYIGDNCCVCNSLFGGETYIGEGTKIDNLVHVGHNLYIGRNAVITAQVIACGSAIIEDGAWIAPNTSILNRVRIGKGAKTGLGSVVIRDVASDTLVYGCPAKNHI